MNHGVDIRRIRRLQAVTQELRHSLCIADVSADELVMRVAAWSMSCLDIRQVIQITAVGEQIQIGYMQIAIAPQCMAHEVRPDEPTATGYQQVLESFRHH